jgi:undecaprenyl-diphosphatase
MYLFAGDRWGLWPTVFAWFVGGVAILAVGWFRRKRQEEQGRGVDMLELTWKMAIIIGVAQCIAMWPGTSRSLVTIVAGILVGMNLKSAVEFSFLLGVVTLTAATAYDGLKHGEAMLEEFGMLTLFLGLLFSWISAVLAVKWMVSYLNRHGLAIFGYYRIALALVVAALILGGVLSF